MKTSNLYFVLLLVVTFICESCNNVVNEPMSGATFSENFIQIYVVPRSIECRQYSVNSIEIKFIGKDLINTRTSDKTEYEKYSIKYRDVSYNGWLVPFSNIIVGEEFELFSVTCNKDFDDDHPAGSSLSDVIMLCATSPRDFIKNGYVGNAVPFPNEFSGLGLYDHNHSYKPIFKLLSELMKNDLVLLNRYCFLHITKNLPTGEYTFTIEIKTVNNVILKSSVEYVVE